LFCYSPGSRLDPLFFLRSFSPLAQFSLSM
jgi:hypothetical protein